jgi:hypothetical protein
MALPPSVPATTIVAGEGRTSVADRDGGPMARAVAANTLSSYGAGLCFDMERPRGLDEARRDAAPTRRFLAQLGFS